MVVLLRTGELPHHDVGHVEGIETSTRRRLHAGRMRRLRRHGARAMTAAIIFGLLIGLMLTGMPISIALGLTVLTFLFTMTQVPIESVALKLFTGIEKFEIMAIPFFILAGNFLTHGGVARRMIDFAIVDGRPLARRPGARRRDGLRAVRRGLGLVAGDGGRDRLDHPAGDGASRASRSASAPA